MIGRNLARYHITAKLGQGGMGTVWKAQDKLLGRAVALKLLPEGLADSPEARRRFLREARSASALDHPGVARVYDAGEAEGLLYIASAYVEGVTLGQQVADGPLPLRDAIRIACAAAEAIGHAHARGVLHRDLSSANIMVGSDGRVTVLDFGLAKIVKDASSRITETGTAIGTVAYMAPEMALGGRADLRSDLYGLGAVLYEMITGNPPFVAERAEAVLYEAVHEPPVPPSTRRPGIPPELDRIVLKLLAKEPDGRYPSAAALLTDLHAAECVLGGGEEEAADAQAAVPGPGRAAWPEPKARAAGVPGAKYLAVLPFYDSTPSDASGQGEAFACGLAEVVSVRLAQVPGVQVIPPSAVPGIAAGAENIRKAARELGANLLLQGSIQRAGRKLRISFSLLDAAAVVQIAGEVLDGNEREILALEDRFVRAVVHALELRGVTAFAEVRHRLSDPVAHEHYLQALGYLQRYENEASLDGAIARLEQLLKSDGETAPIEAALGRAYLHKYRLTLERRWEERAKAACERALKSDPDSPDVRVTMGRLHTVVGRYGEAVREFHRALRLRRGDPEAYLGLAEAHQGVEQFADAERACAMAIALRPNYWGGHNLLGVTFFRQGRYQDAAQQWQRVVELVPDSARGQYNLAAAYYHLGRHEDAAAAYRRSIDIQPTGSAYSGLGTIHFFRGDYSTAAAMFEKSAALQPFDPVKWGNLADAYRWMPGFQERAEAAYDQAIRLSQERLEVNSNDGREWSQLATWLAKRGNTRDALHAMRRGLKLRGKEVIHMVDAAHVHLLAGDPYKALEWLERAVKHGYDTRELEQDPELVALRARPRFQRLLAERTAV